MIVRNLTICTQELSVTGERYKSAVITKNISLAPPPLMRPMVKKAKASTT